MDILFSCRNCIHNCLQSPNIGPGSGFCLLHSSVLWDSKTTTCKYLHRKDLPHFMVDEGIREHAAEFAGFSSLVNLHTKAVIHKVPYSEKFVWENKLFDSLLNTLAQYDKVDKTWIFVQAFSGGVDGRRALVHTSLVRRYMNKCDTWTSTYRLMLALLQEIDIEPHFDPRSLIVEEDTTLAETQFQALWDVIFARIASLQEYGWHAGLEDLMWATDTIIGGLAELNWPVLQEELARQRGKWTTRIIDHAKTEGEFFKVSETILADGLPA